MELTLRRTMRGDDKKQSSMLMLMSPETRGAAEAPAAGDQEAGRGGAGEAVARLRPCLAQRDIEFSSISCADFGMVGEKSSALDFSYTGSGNNACGCPDAIEPCQIESPGLE